MEVQPDGSTSLWGIMGKVGQKLQEAIMAVLINRSVTEDVLSTIMCIVELTLNARPLTSFSSDVTDLEALTTNHFLLLLLALERLFTLSAMRRRNCRPLKPLSTNSDLCKSHMG